MEISKIFLKPISKVLNIFAPNRAPRIFDEQSGLVFWDDINNQAYYDLIKEMREKFWIPEEVSMAQDRVHWNTEMTEVEKELFKNGIGILASLDSVATYFDKIASDYIQDGALKSNMAFIAAMETIHNESYTYTFSSLISKPESLEVFERPKTNPYVIRRNEFIMKNFDQFLAYPTVGSFVQSLISMSGLEGLCFVNGFTPFYHFNRDNKMFGTGTIIQYIQRDETMHTYFQTMLVRDILEQYSDVLDKKEVEKFAYEFFTQLVEYEKEYCEFLYKDYPRIDIEDVSKYIEFRANLILDLLHFDKIFETKKNPMSWIDAFDPDNLNNTKTDFFEGREKNYTRPNEVSNGWDDL